MKSSLNRRLIMKKSFLIISLIIVNMMTLGIGNVRSYIGVGDVAQDFTLMSVDGDSVSLSDYAGQVVLLSFFTHT